VADRQRIEISRGSNPNRAGLRELDRKFGQLNVDMIDRSFAVLAVLDGGDVDSGTAAEVGYASAKGKRVIGLRLDTRVTGDNEGVTVNLQVEHFLSNRDDIARTVGDAIHALGRPTGVRQVPR
jgi:nucleoside 2-deoxyribosyltransferase